MAEAAFREDQIGNILPHVQLACKLPMHQSHVCSKEFSKKNETHPKCKIYIVAYICSLSTFLVLYFNLFFFLYIYSY
jgi:hypothetical protein